MTELNSPNNQSILSMLDDAHDDEIHSSSQSTSCLILFEALTNHFESARREFEHRFIGLGFSADFSRVISDEESTRLEVKVVRVEKTNNGINYLSATDEDMDRIKNEFTLAKQSSNSHGDEILAHAEAKMEIDGETYCFELPQNTAKQKLLPNKQQTYYDIVDSSKEFLAVTATLRSVNLSCGKISLGFVTKPSPARRDTINYGNIDNIYCSPASTQILERAGKRTNHPILLPHHESQSITIAPESELDLLEDFARNLLTEIRDTRKKSAK